jgi:hypothetical protein
MTEAQRPRGRLQLAVIALVFLGPLVLATWMYTSGRFTPDGRSNYGELLEPIVNLGDVLPESPAVPLADGQWLMLYASEQACTDDCRQALYKLRQTRLMVGREMDRINRVFLHGETAPDTLFVEQEHPGLITIRDSDLAVLLEGKRPKHTMPGGIYLIDPLANLVMYFPPDLGPRELVDDVKHLLKLSRIG